MSKLPATKANQVVEDGSGASAGFAGLSSVGESDNTVLVPNERDPKTGYPANVPNSFSGGST